jgi:streptogramin lyase
MCLPTASRTGWRGSAGEIWYTGIQKGVIGRLDPKTGQVKEYPLNESGARGPHTPILDKRTGNIFFTLQSGHVGRINITSGEMMIKKTPSDNTYPYGIRLNSQGVPGTSTFEVLASAASIRRRWRSRSIPCQTLMRVRAG